MRREEFLEALNKAGYAINESKLRRYTEYGLIRPRKTSCIHRSGSGSSGGGFAGTPRQLPEDCQWPQ